MAEDWIIETPRLGLRRLRGADRPLVAEMDWLNTERVMSRSTGAVWPFGFLAVVLKEVGGFCGICGLLRQDLEHGVEIEVGYHLLPRFHGMGIATEAARGMMDYAFRQLRRRRIVSLIRHDNLPSLRVAEKNGLQHERDVLFRGAVHGMHVIRRDLRETD